jgi:hypothetical protein
MERKNRQGRLGVSVYFKPGAMQAVFGRYCCGGLYYQRLMQPSLAQRA